MSSVAVVDSGTSTTRVRIVRGTEVSWAGKRGVGARDAAIEGNNRRLREALSEMLEEAAATEADLEAAVFSGMITSNVGLLEVPHLIAPVTADDLAGGLVKHDFPEVTPLPCYFVPGVRTVGRGDDLAELDLLRGEEVEILGLRTLLGITDGALFVHYGSHTKAIDVDRDGSISGSRTGLTGELLSAICDHTIISSSVEPLEGLELVADGWRHGLADAQRLGLGRTLFLVRVGEQSGRYDRRYMTSYLLGALCSLDLPLVTGIGSRTVVLYGRSHLRKIMTEYLSERGGFELISVEDDLSERAAAVGAAQLMRMALQPQREGR